MTLSPQIIDFVGLHRLYDTDQTVCVGQISVVQAKANIGIMRILVEMVDARGIERGGAALDPVDFVVLLEQEFGQVGSVLAGDAGDQGFLHYFTPGLESLNP